MDFWGVFVILSSSVANTLKVWDNYHLFSEAMGLAPLSINSFIIHWSKLQCFHLCFPPPTNKKINLTNISIFIELFL